MRDSSVIEFCGAKVGEPYSEHFRGAKRDVYALPCAVKMTGGALPPGLTISDGVLAGTPASAGRFAWQIDFTDARGVNEAVDYEMTVAA